MKNDYQYYQIIIIMKYILLL